jgi:hypothetical protein
VIGVNSKCITKEIAFFYSGSQQLQEHNSHYKTHFY